MEYSKLKVSFFRNFIAYGLTVFLWVSCSQEDIRTVPTRWMGPEANGHYPDTGLLKEWPEEGPEKLFVAEDLGRGFSSAVATSERIYVTGIRDSIEYMTALDLKGKQLWQKAIGPCYNQSFSETRSTPTVEEERVYVLTGMDKMTGELIWKSKTMNANRGNMSPALIEHCGKDYFITSTQTDVLGLDPENGEILWNYHYNFLSPAHENTTILVNTPTYKDSCLWISNGWEVPSIMLEIAPDGRSVSEKFRDQTFDNQNHGVVLVDGFLYGSNFTGRNSGKWVCMNWDSGEIVWIADFYNKGPIIYADGMLYLYEEKRGHLGLVNANPKKFELVSSFRHYEGAGAHWARPTIFNQVLYLRHGDTLTGYKIARQ